MGRKEQGMLHLHHRKLCAVKSQGFKAGRGGDVCGIGKVIVGKENKEIAA